jgi:hypothetical protein
MRATWILAGLALVACPRGAVAEDGAPPDALAPDREILGSVGAVQGGGWTPGGLRIDARYGLSLDAATWLEIGPDVTLGRGAAGCHQAGSDGYACDHGLYDGDAVGLGVAVRHDFGAAGVMQPFVRVGGGVEAIRFSDHVSTKTDSAKPNEPTFGMYGVAILARVAGGVRIPVSPDLAVTASAEVETGVSGFAGTADAQRQLDFQITAGAEFRPSNSYVPMRRGKLLSLAGVAAVYAPFVTWEYYAWYHGAYHQPLWFDIASHDESLSAKTYAGGADKFGHAWAHYTLTRGTTEILVAGGWNHWAAGLICFGIDQLEATFSEMKDGPVWGYEIGDSISNLTGALLAVAMENFPALDALFDFRLQYWPSSAYIKLLEKSPTTRGDGLDFSQDYTGQTYMLAFHLDELPYDHGAWYLKVLDYTDAVIGFESRHYEPNEPTAPRFQHEYAGVAINVQALLSALLHPSRGLTIGRGIAEVYSLPYTTLRFVEHTSTASSSSNTTAL